MLIPVRYETFEFHFGLNIIIYPLKVLYKLKESEIVFPLS